MNLQSVQDFLQSRARINTNDVETLEQFVEQYPWFSIGLQLLLKGYKDTSNPAYNELAKIVPLYALSRRRLFFFIEESANDTYIELDFDRVIESIPATQQAKRESEVENDERLMSFNNEFFTVEQLGELEDDNSTSNNELIAKFIQTNPRIIPKMVNTDTKAESMAKEEVEEELASEILADIYVQQGFYDLAIKCYKKLSLQNPKKSSYFADLIENVTKLK